MHPAHQFPGHSGPLSLTFHSFPSTEIKLQRGNAKYKEDGTFLIPDLKLKHNILECLTQEIVRFKVYVTDKEFNSVGEALIAKHPCLSERGSITGYAGWKVSLKNKLAMYRTQLRKLGCPEVVVNSAKNKSAGQSAASGIKRPRRCEVNYCPPYPAGETDQSLESLRISLLLDIKKKNNRDVVRKKMERSFAYRRLEVVRDTPMVQDVKARWPALFDINEINAEFKRITTIPLQSRFLSQLDVVSAKLQKLFEKRGGQIGQRLLKMMEPVAQNEDDVDLGRECIIKALCVYLNEDPDNLVREFAAADEDYLQTSIEETTLGIYVVRSVLTNTAEDIGIVLEGQIVFQDLDNIALATAVLFGLIYALNLNYPPSLKYTFEVLQKLVMELEGSTLSKKVQLLKNRLCELDVFTNVT
ncbi:uncharacterized protein [Nothobranchius furzeri]|uniref:uncharacterized protein n=1 Tax=Nothobranchius furzeri TaxID=105023 RepID=UPI00077D316D